MDVWTCNVSCMNLWIYSVSLSVSLYGGVCNNHGSQKGRKKRTSSCFISSKQGRLRIKKLYINQMVYLVYDRIDIKPN